MVTVHDLSVWLHPEWHPADRVGQHRKRFAEGLRHAQHVVVVSDAVKRELVEEFDIAPERVTRVYNGVSKAFQRHDAEELKEFQQVWGLGSRYLLAVGSVEPRKNLLTVLRAYVDLPERLRRECPLVLAGPWGWKSEDVKVFFERHGTGAGVIRLGYVPDEDLPKLYAGATALVFPTLYEGFGLPPLEMLAVGGRVLVSDIPVTREILGSHATFLPSMDAMAWRDAMHTVMEVGPTFTEKASAYAQSFGWNQTVQETLQVYRRVLGISKPRDLRLAA